MTADYQCDVSEAAGRAPRDVHDVDGAHDAAAATNASLDDLRAILIGEDRVRIADLEAQVQSLEQQIEDRDALIAIISPVMGEAIRCKIRDNRDEVIEALYPIIGQLVVRAVTEAMRDLARSIDNQMRTSFSPSAIMRRLRARFSGVSDGEMMLRESLPFSVAEVFLIHRETGLLLCHISREPDLQSDSDLVSGMLTAIRDFVQDAFGRGKTGGLDEIQYGDQRILIEASRHAYLAVVIDGIEPPGFRSEIRERLIEIQNSHALILEQFDGDASRFEVTDEPLRSLLRSQSVPADGLTATQKRILAMIGVLLVLCLLVACLGGGAIWRSVWGAGTSRPEGNMPQPVAVLITASPSRSPTWTATPSPTVTMTPFPTVTFTPVPTATSRPSPTKRPTATETPRPQVRAVVQASLLNVRSGPGTDYAVLGQLEDGQVLDVIGRDGPGNWWQACCLGPDWIGWVSADYVRVEGPVEAIPVVVLPNEATSTP